MESADLVFALLNLSVLPWWGIWLVAPRSALARLFAGHAAVFIGLGVVYTSLLAAALVTEPLQGFGFESVRATLGSPLGFLTGWTHFLALDLFCGAWIVRESNRLSLEPRLFLFFAMMLAPIGLAGFLLRRALYLRSLGQLGEVDLA
ncbi:MAG: abscisic acid-deficient protein Aba4 family protein [Myxococcota bacterium]